MADIVGLTIDGKEVHVPETMNILEAAGLAGIHIPNLCYLKGMKSIGACRLCLVEVKGMKAPVIACNTRVKDGMIVNTKTEKLEEVRRFVIDLILSMHPFDCMTCTKAGVCRLQEYAYDLGIKESSFTRKKFAYPADEKNPLIKRDPEYCILCSRCVQICKAQGTSVLDFMGRGVEAKVITAQDKPLQESGCTFCGSCIDVCPVNAFLETDRWRKGREWEYEKVTSICLLCGDSCTITVSTKGGIVQRINAGAAEGSAERYICAYGRFGFDCIQAETRLTSPMKRINGQLKETTWEDALSIVAERLKTAGKDAGFISVASITNEDALALKRFAKDVVKTNNLDSTMSLYADADSLRRSRVANIDDADLIILVGLSPSQWERILPALDASVRKKVNRGAKLIVINSSETKIAEAATVNLGGDEVSNLKAIVKVLIEKGFMADEELVLSVKDAYVTEDIEKAADLVAGSLEPLIFSSPSLFWASANISLLKGKVISVALESNARGIALMGLTTGGRTYKEMVGTAESEEQSVQSGVKVLYAVGEVPLNKRPDGVDFLIIQNSHLTELAQQAEVVLPSATFLEYAGTIVDYMGRLKYLPKVIEPQGGSKSHRDIFIQLSRIMGLPLKSPTEAEVKKAAKVKTKLSYSPFVRREGFDISPGELVEYINASVINGSRLFWLREVERATTV